MKSISNILALDPGRTTGYAIAIVEDGTPHIGYHQEQLDHRGFYQLIESCGYATGDGLNIVCEDFRFRQNKTGVDLYPCELIGILHYYAATHMSTVFLQNASVQGAKAYFSDKRLREMGLYQKEYPHGRSAVKHLLHWLQFAQGAELEADIEQSELVTIQWAKYNLV